MRYLAQFFSLFLIAAFPQASLTEWKSLGTIEQLGAIRIDPARCDYRLRVQTTYGDKETYQFSGYASNSYQESQASGVPATITEFDFRTSWLSTKFMDGALEPALLATPLGGNSQDLMTAYSTQLGKSNFARIVFSALRASANSRTPINHVYVSHDDNSLDGSRVFYLNPQKIELESTCPRGRATKERKMTKHPEQDPS